MYSRFHFFCGATTGALLMYLFDPVSGQRRRTMLREQFVLAPQDTSGEAEGPADKNGAQESSDEAPDETPRAPRADGGMPNAPPVH